MRTFEFSDESSSKFWNVSLDGANLTVTFGKVGSKGQTKTKTLADAAAARKEHDKLIAEKLKNGYRETTAPTPPAQSAATPLQRSLEEALAENPDDLASHAAYADYLTEQNDPRGEFVQVQLSLEDPKRPAKERARLQKREAELLSQHARTWLGDAGRFLVGDWSGPDLPWRFQFARGWLDSVRLLPFPPAVSAAVARSPESRLLRRLEIVYDMRYHPFEFDEHLLGPNAAMRDDDESYDAEEMYEPVTVMPPLLASPHLTNLRWVKIGYSDDGESIVHSTMVNPFGSCTAAQVIELLRKNPRLEELYVNFDLGRTAASLFASPALGSLRVLQYYFGSGYFGGQRGEAYPLDTLAKNPALGRLTTLRLHAGRDATIGLEQFEALLRSTNLPNLTHLQVHMSTFGDEGCRAVVESGIVKRLKVLDLGYGAMTDEGARLLADCYDVHKLDVLDVSRNALAASGIAALRSTGVRVLADEQHDAGDNAYLWEVDVE